MTRRRLPLLIIAAALPLAAEEPAPAADTVRQAAMALGNGDAAAFAAAFDPAMPGFAALRKGADELMQQADVQSTIDFGGESGDNSSRTLQMDWHLRIEQRGISHAIITRQAHVKCRLLARGGQWRIAALEPPGLFTPARVDGAWDVLESAAAALSNGDAASFLSSFDPSMPDYETVRSGVMGLAEEGEVQSSVDLIANDGTDTVRTLDVDWTLQIVDEDNGIRRGGRELRVQCRLQLQGKRWRITGVAPTDFFGPISLGANIPHDADNR